MTSISKMTLPAQVEPNLNGEKTSFEQLEEFTSKSRGAYQTLDITYKSIKLINEINKARGRSPVLVAFESEVGTAKNILTLTALPAVTLNAKKAIKKAVAHPHDAAAVIRAGTSTSKAVGQWLVLANRLMPSPLLVKISLPLVVVNRTVNLGIQSSALARCNRLQNEIERHEKANEQPITEEVKRVVADTKTYTILKLIHAVCGAVSTLFGLGLFVSGFGSPLAIALILIGLIASVCTVAADFFRNSRPYQLIHLD